MRKRRHTLLVASLLSIEYPPSHSNGAEMYSEGYMLNASSNSGFCEKALTCKYASSSPHINSHAESFVSMGFPCLQINFMNFSKYGFFIEAIDLVYTPRMHQNSIIPSLQSNPMVLHKSKIHDSNVNKFDLNVLK